jgi:hypothetical protein
VALPKYRGMMGTVATVAREEGLAALWKGIIPGLHRQCIYGGLRIGLYDPVSSTRVFRLRCVALLMHYNRQGIGFIGRLNPSMLVIILLEMFP